MNATGADWVTSQHGVLMCNAGEDRWTPKQDERWFLVYMNSAYRYWFPVSQAQMKVELGVLRIAAEGAGLGADQAVYVDTISFPWPTQGLKCSDLATWGHSIDENSSPSDLLNVPGQVDVPGSADDFLKLSGSGLGELDAMKWGNDPFGNETNEMRTGQLDADLQKLAGALMADAQVQGAIQSLRKKFGLPTDGRERGRPTSGDGQNGGNDVGSGDQSGKGEGSGTGTDGGDTDGGEDGGENGGGTGGSGGWFPSPFSPWFNTVFEILCQSMPKACDISKKALLLGYIVAPEVFDHIASYLAKVQHTLTPRTMDDALNTASDIYRDAAKYLKYVNMAMDLMKDPGFKQLLDRVSLDEVNMDRILKGAQMTHVLSEEQVRAIRENFPVDLFDPKVLKDPNALKGGAQRYAVGQLKRGAKKIPGIGGVLDVDAIARCIPPRADCAEEVLRGTAKNATRYLPAKYQGAARALIDGSVEEAGKQLMLDQLGDRPGCRRILEEAFRSGEAFTPDQWADDAECLKEATRGLPGAHRIASYADLMKAVGQYGPQAIREVKSLYSAQGMPDVVVNELLRGGTKLFTDWVIDELGFSSPEAIRLMKLGELDQALAKELETRSNSRMDANHGREWRAMVQNRYKALRAMAQAMRSGTIKINSDPFDRIRNSQFRR